MQNKTTTNRKITVSKIPGSICRPQAEYHLLTLKFKKKP